ncbi:MAG TPA: EthD domain-containing protein [Burkholderiales bacterium]|nr:EthD domain-containing protein [Burkholderiales bacterium]
MIKAVIFFKRLPGMSLAAFHEHWRVQHAAIIVRLPGIRRYVQNYPLGEAPFDAIAESSFDDTQAMKTLARTPEYAEVLEDEPRFIDRPSMGSIITEEHILKDGPASTHKTMLFIKRKANVPVDDFFRGLLEDGRRAAQAPGVVRYAQCHTRRSAYDSGRTPAYDAVTMTWFASAPSAVPGAIAVNQRVVL